MGYSARTGAPSPASSSDRRTRNYSGYAPDLPVRVATGTAPERAETEICEAIEFHLEGLRQDGAPLPLPVSTVEYVDVRI
jgi:predicted RNase H-like HicB family nuclease